MACRCGSKKHEANYINKETMELVSKTHFSESEINELRNRFYKISNSNKRLSKQNFKENMGILGLDTAFLLSERVFHIMDEDQDGEISLGDFVKYMDILLNGSKRKKNELSFNMIDYNKKGWFEKSDFKELIESIITVWAHLTGNHLNENLLKRIEMYIEDCFNRLDVKGKGAIGKEDFIDIIESDPDVLEIFDFINRGGKNIFTNEELEKRERDERLARKLIKLEKNLKKVNEFIQEHFPIQNTLVEERNFNTSPAHSPNKVQNNENAPVIPFGLIKEKEIFSPPVVKTNRNSYNYPKVHGFEKNMERILNEVKNIGTEINQFDIDLHPTTLKQKTLASNIIKPTIFNDFSHSDDRKKDTGYINQIILQEDNIFDGEDRLTVSKRKTNNFSFNQGSLHLHFNSSEDEDNGNPHARLEKSKSNNFDVKNKEKNTQIKTGRTLNGLNLEASPFRRGDRIMNTTIALKEMLQITKEMREDFDKNIDKINEKTNQNYDQPLRKFTTFTTHNVHKSTVSMKTKGKSLHKKKRKEKKNEMIRSPTNTNPLQNQTVVFLGHQNWNLVLNMMLGIQMAVKSIIPFGGNILTSKDFDLKYYFELVPRRSDADKKTFKICKFFDYAPHVFNEIRNLFGISKESYLSSIGPENLLSNLLKGNLNTLRELVSSGKSGSFFYYSADGKYTLKTIHRHEFHLIRKILPKYYKHLMGNPNSFIVRFFGLHKMRINLKNSIKGKKIYFIIMSNVFQTAKEIHQRYDIKGSTYKRITKENDPSIALKDLNAIENNFKMKLTPQHAKFIVEQLKVDCKFFEECSIIDYSLLIGVHQMVTNNIMLVNGEMESSSEFFSLMNSKMLEDNPDSKLQLVGFKSQDGSAIYFLGIIDILTSFNTKKKFEYGFKYLIHGSKISAIPPIPYSRRFQDFIGGLIESHLIITK